MSILPGIYASQITGHLSTNSYESIATQAIGAGGAASVTFSSIPSTYKHLQVRLIARSDVANIQHNLYMRLNGDTGANYSWHQLVGDSQSAYAQAQSSVTAITNVGTIPGATESANIFLASVIDVLDYANTNKNKTVRSLNGKEDNTTGTVNGIVALCSGAWFSTSAVNSLTLYSGGSGNFVQYSSFALYGIK